MIPEIIITVVIAAFILEFFDAGAGMGFGTLTPVLILLGYSPIVAVPAVLFCSSVLSLIGGVMHHTADNVDFFDKKTYKIIFVFLAFGFFAIFLGVFAAVSLPESAVDIYIGLLVLAVGIFIIRRHSRKKGFSWKKIIAFGSIASFNKGMTGAGFGPVISGGQILAGIKSKDAVGITAITEGTLSMIGVITFAFIGGPSRALNWPLIASLLLGGLVSIPIAVYTVKKLHPKHMRFSIGMISIIMGILLIARVLIKLAPGITAFI
jgi:uncharacterized membrane protein YfcA